MTGPAEQHLDLDALADVLAEEDTGAPLPEHLQTCAACAAELTALRSAVGQVRADLASLPPVPPVPADLGDRLRAAIAAGTSAGTTVLPAAEPVSLEQARSRRGRRLAVAGGLAAAAVLVVGGGLLLDRGATDSSTSPTAARDNPSGQFPVSSSGTDYRSNAALQAALPTLLGSRQETTDSAKAPSAAQGLRSTASRPAGTADPLAVLRTPSGLASCLAGLSDPKDPGVPLALDYASYKGSPALVVVLPSAKPSKVDVWVVGAGCTQQDSQLKLYLRADRPVR